MSYPRIVVNNGETPQDIGSGTPLRSGDGGGTYDGMEERVARLEKDVTELRADTKTVLRELSEIKGKLSNLPTTMQLVLFVIAVLGIAGVTKIFG